MEKRNEEKRKGRKVIVVEEKGKEGGEGLSIRRG